MTMLLYSTLQNSIDLIKELINLIKVTSESGMVIVTRKYFSRETEILFCLFYCVSNQNLIVEDVGIKREVGKNFKNK